MYAGLVRKCVSPSFADCTQQPLPIPFDLQAGKGAIGGGQVRTKVFHGKA